MSEQVKLERAENFKLPTAVLGMSSVDSDSNRFFAACMDGVYRVDLASGDSMRIGTHDSYVSSVQRAGSLVISAGYDGDLQFFDLEQQRRVRRLHLHRFWSWDMAVSPDGMWAASVTGQYLPGGYKYEPAAESEPSVKVVSIADGKTILELPHVPSVQAVAFSPDSQFVAAGNLMGEVRVWNVPTGDRVATFTTKAFTSWGIIKSHCYLGGIFAMRFTADGEHLLLCGMGPMRDPMAGNGRQLWQKWKWHETQPAMVDQTHKDESGEGLMEALAFSPDGTRFAMGGRLRGGDWNVALFDAESGARLAFLKTGYRATGLEFTPDAKRLVVVGTQGQPKGKNEGDFPDFGRVESYTVG